MNLFEMTFHVEHVDDSLVDMLIDDYEATVGTDHTGYEFVTVLAEGDSFDHAARTMVTKLQCHGLRVRRLVPDLLTRSEIAARLGVTRQAVQNWTSGRRQSGFPLAVNPVGGGAWSWHDVWAWALSHGQLVDDGLRYPTQVETDIINAWIESGMTVSWTCRPEMKTSFTVPVLTDHDQSRLGGYSNVSYSSRTEVIA
jgi:hypothetical protein